MNELKNTISIHVDTWEVNVMTAKVEHLISTKSQLVGRRIGL